jgi:hypothetical protein
VQELNWNEDNSSLKNQQNPKLSTHTLTQLQLIVLLQQNFCCNKVGVVAVAVN